MRISLEGIPACVLSLVRRIVSARGQAMLVGGAVIDMVQGRTPKDWDLEVFRLSYDDLSTLLSDLNPMLVGRSFGIIKVNVSGLDIDLNVPRTDNMVGFGH